MLSRARAGAVKLLVLACAASMACSAVAATDAATALHAKYRALSEQLQHSPFKQPLLLDSLETPDQLKGDIYAIVEYPLTEVSSRLNNPDNWCEVMLLHINTKYCHAIAGASGTRLRLYIGKKTAEELEQAQRMEFAYTPSVASADYFGISLYAQDGPLGTSEYHILLEAVALAEARTFLHLSYSYAVSFSGRLAMQTYLATVGSNKVGFTLSGEQLEGHPAYIGGMRGLVERNTLRYYLAIDSFLAADAAAPAAHFEQGLQRWITTTEHYPRQLHELERGAYLEMKRAEYQRQQTLR